jgi:TetR/AcrR family transcriptional repressor of mexJK operon
MAVAARVGPGRPRDLEKRDAILDAAGQLFCERGYEGCAIETVAARAGVSKTTVYGHFGDKAALFSACVRRVSTQMEAPLEGVPDSVADLRTALVAFGVTLLGFKASPRMLLFERLLMSEAQHHPELARLFFAAGPGPVCAKLERLLAEAHRRGQLAVPDPHLAADVLIGMWQGLAHLRRLLGLDGEPDRAALEAYVRPRVELFLRAFARS